jgi:hypothetical protein
MAWSYVSNLRGPPGHSSDDAPYKWSTNTAATDPGSGNVKANNATPGSITHLYASATDQTGTGTFGLLQLVDQSDVYLYETGNTGANIHFTSVGTPVNNGPNVWFDITVSLVVNNGFTPGNNQAVQLYLPVKGGTGPPGVPGVNACTLSTANFTVPPVGGTVTVPVQDASWMVIGQPLSVTDAGGPGVAAMLRVTAKSGNNVTLLNPS